MPNTKLRRDAEKIIQGAIQSVLPDEAVKKALEKMTFSQGKVYLVAVGKAAWQMAYAAEKCMHGKLEQGIVVTKYGHVQGEIPGVKCVEAGHPVPDENTFAATEKILNMTENLMEEDVVIFLLSGGGSALFEKPVISAAELSDITEQLLCSGADIVEMNTIRKRLSLVKGGKFARHCAPAHIYSIILSDILGDPLDMIASGPAVEDTSTCEQAKKIVKKYHLKLSEDAEKYLSVETPKQVNNVTSYVTGSVKNLCLEAKKICEKLGYESYILTDQLNCEAREAGSFMAAIAKTYQKTEKKMAFIAGGETVVHVRGKGKGGRNQELALAAAKEIQGMSQVAIFSVGSDGTDGPTDAAGGYVDGQTAEILQEKHLDIEKYLEDNDAYHALKKSDGLIVTGPTGTNVNDFSVLLVDNILG